MIHRNTPETARLPSAPRLHRHPGRPTGSTSPFKQGYKQSLPVTGIQTVPVVRGTSIGVCWRFAGRYRVPPWSPGPRGVQSAAACGPDLSYESLAQISMDKLLWKRNNLESLFRTSSTRFSQLVVVQFAYDVML